eukprot:6609461-Prymnesium_polylepis.1
MISTRCQLDSDGDSNTLTLALQSIDAPRCCFAFLEVIASSCVVGGSAMALYTVYPPILRKFAVAELKKRTADNDTLWEEQTCGQKYCYGSLLIMPNFVGSVGTTAGWVGSLIVWAVDGNDVPASLWFQLMCGALVFYVLSLDPFMRRNGRQGTGFIYAAFTELLPWYPTCYLEFMERRL